MLPTWLLTETAASIDARWLRLELAHTQHGVHQAAVLAAAALCGLPAMASNETLELALVAERGDGEAERLSDNAHTAAGALQLMAQVRRGYAPQPFIV